MSNFALQSTQALQELADQPAGPPLLDISAKCVALPHGQWPGQPCGNQECAREPSLPISDRVALAKPKGEQAAVGLKALPEPY